MITSLSLVLLLILHLSLPINAECNNDEDNLHCGRNFNECSGDLSRTRYDCVECHDRDSCKDTTIYAKKVYCRGDHSCKNAIITSTKKNIYCIGDNSCEGATLNTERRNIECEGKLSCYKATMTSKRKISCFASESCKLATISSRKETQCTAYQSCFEATINSEGSIECNGEQSCKESKNLQTEKYVRCEGSESCMNSKQITAGKDILCYGYKACFDVEDIIKADDDVICAKKEKTSESIDSDPSSDQSVDTIKPSNYGQNACQSSNIEAQKKIECRRLYSCRDTTLKADTIKCVANNACLNARVTISDENNFRCDGTDACKGVRLNGQPYSS